MGKIIKFDPARRRKQARSWTRPEDYIALPPREPPARQAAFRPDAPERTTPVRWPARLAVAGLVLAAVAASLFGVQ
ncbi:hypothetical protein [Qipengyuania thermophila]|uniref:hypothetical protein n=1 Tax=Qipengyuania thermophila TaxID=2509361 RepID=UPI0013E9DFA8|nr:hypothetical protein [Qipengyuania thermophila]